jgi:hypothetical protein
MKQSADHQPKWTPDEIGDYFFLARSLFALWAWRHPELSDRRVDTVRLRISKSHFLGKQARARDLAWYDPQANEIHLLARTLHGKLSTIVGLIWHELGHAADAQSDKPGAERRADAIALAAVGKPVRYTKSGVQDSDRGTAWRPDWLHQ